MENNTKEEVFLKQKNSNTNRNLIGSNLLQEAFAKYSSHY
jgi:hypothetical protein